MPTTNFKNSSGTDIGNTLVEKSYLIDRYPELADTFKQAGAWGWGYNSLNNLGDGTTTNRSSPVQVLGGGTNWTILSSGRYHTAGIKSDNTLWVWGYDDVGQLGVNTTGVTRSTPVQTVAAGTNWKQVSCGNKFSAAIKTDGTLWTWGRNNFGQLGDGTTTNNPSPIQIAGTTWKQVSAGFESTGVIKTDGTLWTFGVNEWPAVTLGVGDSTNRSSPTQVAGTTWKQVSMGRKLGGAIKTDGTLWMWGDRSDGGVGDGSTSAFVSMSSPIQTTAGGTNWKQLSVGGLCTSAIKTDGTLWGWGWNPNGKIGDGTTTTKSTPVQVAGTTWKSVNNGHGTYTSPTAAIKTDGTLWVWGYNGYGAMGDNTTVDRSSPVQTITGSSNWKLVACGMYFVTAIRDDSADIFGNTL